MLSNTDLSLALRKKILILSDMVELSKKQLTLVDLTALPSIFQKKEQYIEELQRIDEIMDLWQKQSERKLLEENSKYMAKIRELLETLAESENKFEEKLRSEQKKITLEMKQLGNQNRLKNYLDNRKASGTLYQMSH